MMKAWNRYLVSMLCLLPLSMPAQIFSKKSNIRFLALGDSYTIGESVAEPQRWPNQLVDYLSRDYTFQKPKIIAVTGWRTDQLKQAIMEANLSTDYDLVSLLIGVNNQYQGRSITQYEKEFLDLLQMSIRQAHGDKSRVFVISIPDYGFTPFGKEKQKEISRQIDAFNEVNKSVTLENGVTYVNITDISRRGLKDPQLIAEDGLHPSGKMYSLWVEHIVTALSSR